jgi:hypothetical protein
MLPGFTIQLPSGKPVSIILPVAISQVGWVIVPITGAGGTPGWVLITTLADKAEVHPEALVTVKLYVPGTRPVTVVLDPDPETDPGLIVQLPEGKPDKTTLPVIVEQVSWVIAPTIGAAGVAGWGLIVITDELAEVHPTELVTVKV